MDIQQLLIFVSIALIATITPGPAILLATTHSLTYGLKSSVFTILGNITGLFIMSALSVAGLSAIILSSDLLFSLVKLLGAFYLIYLGAKLWKNGFGTISPAACQSHQKANHKKLYLNGLMVALSNPKAIAFTTALFPQFINPGEAVFVQFSVLVTIFMLLSFLCIFAYAYAVRTTQKKLMASPHHYLSKLFAAVFILSGIALASTVNNKG